MSVNCSIVKEEIEIYDSYWVGCNPIPIQFKIESDKFPINQFDTQDIIDIIQDNDGFAQVQVSSSYEEYNTGEWVTIEDSNIDGYNGVWKIKSVYNDLITLDLPFLGNASNGTIQRYYYNYYVDVRVYAGIPNGHYFESENPIQLITTLHIQPSPDNIAYIDVAEAVRSQFEKIKNEVCEQLEMSYDYAINDRNAWTSFYIEFQESYDIVDNEGNITTFESGYNNGNEILNENPDFKEDLSGYSIIANSESWIWSPDFGGSAKIQTSSSFTSDELYQSLSLDAGETYRVKLVYSIYGDEPFGEMSIKIDGSTVITDLFEGVNIEFKEIEYNYQSIGGIIDFGFSAFVSNPSSTDYELYVHSFEITIDEPILYFAINGTQQIGYPYGNNFGEYVLNDNNLELPTKFLTLFSNPYHFEGYEYNISIIRPTELNGVDLNFKVIEYDGNGNELLSTRYEMPNYDEGVYRLLLSFLVFEPETKKYELYIEKNEGSYERISEIKTINYITDCCRYSPALVSWYNYLGAWEYFLFCGAKQFQTNFTRGSQITRNIFSQWDGLFTAGVEQLDNIQIKSRDGGKLRSNIVSKLDYDMLRKWLVGSIKVQKVIDIDENTICVESKNRRTILLTEASVSYEDLDKLLFLDLAYNESNENLIQRQ